MKTSKTRAFTQIAMTVSAMIVGGFAIYLVSGRLPFPGLKYVLMGPYLSMMITLVLVNFEMTYSVFYVNTVFAMIMGLIHPVMGGAIFLTGLLTQILNLLVRQWRHHIVITASGYAAFTVASALAMSKWFIGEGAFEAIDGPYILILAAVGAVMGFFGCHAGLLIGRRIRDIRQI